MKEDLLTLLPTPMMLPPIIVGVSPEGIAEGLDEPSLWSLPTEVPAVADGFEPEVDPAGCVPLWPSAGVPPGPTRAPPCPTAPGCPRTARPWRPLAGRTKQPPPGS